jgi:hypothetical protein
MRDDDESDPEIPAPRRSPVSPRTLFDEDDERPPRGSASPRAEPPAPRDADDDASEGSPFPITAILLVAVIAGVLGYVAVRQFLAPSGPASASLAPLPPVQESSPPPPAKQDYFDPLVPTGGAGSSAPGAPGTAPTDGGPGEPDRAAEPDMVPVEPDVPPDIPPPSATGPAAGRGFEEGSDEARGEAARGDFARAARLWSAALSSGADPGSWTVQVSANCETSTLKPLLDALGTSGGSGGGFLLPVTIGGKACYRVCTGTYPDRASAEAAISRLPRLNPPPSPRAVPLDALLPR